MWIESHQSLLRHRKTNQAVRLLGCDRFKLIGHLHALWWWAMDNAPSGQPLADYEIVDGAEWDGNPEHFVNGLARAGFIDALPDGDYLIHDWHDFTGRLVELKERTRQANRDRQRRWRERNTPPPAPDNALVTRDVTPNNGLTVPNPTQPDLTRDPPTVDSAANAATAATKTELMTLHVIHGVKGYPFEYETDLAHIRALAVDFPDVDVLGTLKDWAAAKTTDPIKAKGRPRAEHRNWCRKRAEWSANGTAKNGTYATGGRATGRGQRLPPDEIARIRAARTGA